MIDLTIKKYYNKGGMASIGLLQEYTKEEDFSVYICRMENYFITNNINGLENKRAIFLNICGHDTYCLLYDLLFPRVLEEVSLLEILQVLWDLYIHQKSVIVDFFKCNQQKQCDKESVMVYIDELQKWSINCAFGDTLVDMLRDRLWII